MVIFSYYLFIWTVVSIIKGHSALNIDFNKYVDEKLQEHKLQIAKEISQEYEPVKKKFYDIYWEKLWSEPLGKNRVVTINMFDGLFTFDGDHFMTLSENTSSNHHLSLKQIPFTHDQLPTKIYQQPVKYIRSIAWKGVTYLLVCHDNFCFLYTGMSDFQFKYKQTFRMKGHPMDACFFTQANRLYLVIIDNVGLYSVPSIIYHWTGTYMDIVDEVTTTSAVAVTTFKHKRSTIIIFAQNSAFIHGTGSEVYEFRDDNSQRIQFLQTTNPIAIHHYDYNDFHFILFINKNKSSSVFWWDNREFLNWILLPEIESSSLIQVTYINGETFFFIAHDNFLEIYKVSDMSNWSRLDYKKLKDNQTVIDMSVKIDGITVLVMLIILEPDDIYRVEPWKLQIKEITSEETNPLKEIDAPKKCFSKLIDLLQARRPEIDKSEKSWSYLLPAAMNFIATEPMDLPNLIFESGTIKHIDFLLPEEISLPRKIKKNINDLEHEINNLLIISKRDFNGNVLSVPPMADISIENDAIFDTLEVDSIDVEFLNGRDIHVDNLISSKNHQKFSVPLVAENVVVENLEISHICGIPSENWLLKNGTRSRIDIDDPNIDISNDTVHVHTNLTLSSLNTNILNNITVNQLFDELFILGHNQTINGSIIYKNYLQTTNLTIERLNKIPSENFVTKVTNQTFDKFTMRELEVENLSVDIINDIPVAESARKSQENIIKGLVKLANLQTDILDAESLNTDKIILPNTKSQQIYENVTITGNVKIENIDMNPNSRFILSGNEVKLNQIFETVWTKSTDQVIVKNTSFDAGITIDYVNTNYLNNHLKNDFLYTTMKEIPKNFSNLYLEDLYFNGSVSADDKENEPFEIDEDLMIRQSIHIGKLIVDKLFANVINNVRVNVIMDSTEPLNFTGSAKFDTLHAKTISVQEIDLNFLNEKNVSEFLKDVIYIDEDLHVDSIAISEFNVHNLTINQMNNIKLQKLAELKNLTANDLKRIVIEGHLEIENDLEIETIDNDSPETYVNQFAHKDIIIPSEEIIRNLTVQNLTTRFLRGHAVQPFFDGILSKSKEQTIPAQFSFNKITSGNSIVRSINRQNISNLMWIDEPLTLTGNFTFTELFVESDVIVQQDLNGYNNMTELYDELLIVPLREIQYMNVTGNVSWTTPLTKTNSLSSLFENAVTKNMDQIIQGDTFFVGTENRVSAVSGRFPRLSEIRQIILDAVIDDGEAIEIKGRKIFLQDLVVNSLSADEKLDISIINDIDIRSFNASVVRKYEDSLITGHVTFLEEAKTETFIVNDNNLHGSPIDQLARKTEKLRRNIIFQNLFLRRANLKYLDGKNFDEVVKGRITLRGNHEINLPVRFNGLVTVTGNAMIGTVNGINTSDLVLNRASEPQAIKGKKMVAQNLEVDGNIDAPYVNNINFVAEYENGILNDEDVEIFGDLYFESEVRVTNTTVSKLINQVDINNVMDDLSTKKQHTLRLLKQSETKIEDKLAHSRNIASTLPNLFYYLEKEQWLEIQVPGAKKVQVVTMDETTILNVHNDQPGPFCGLPSSCSCPIQYIVELNKEGCRSWHTNNTHRIWNFHEPYNKFGINIITNTLANSLECTLDKVHDEFTTISWMTVDTLLDSGQSVSNERHTSVKVKGFLKDSKVFLSNDQLYIVLAIHYDPLTNTHDTKSLIYKLNFTSEELKLHQEIPTKGAWSIEIFKIRFNSQTYMLIGCYSDNPESLLYKFDHVNSKFVLSRSFATRSRLVNSLIQETDCFIFLDDSSTNAVFVYRYDPEFDNFYHYQSLFYDTQVTDIAHFYVGEPDNSDAYIIVTTDDGQFYIYEYMFSGKFQARLHYWIDNLQTAFPFYFNKHHYIFLGSKTNSTVVRIVKQDSFE